MLPRYATLNEVIRGAGCRRHLPRLRRQRRSSWLPLWLEVGINLFWPLEMRRRAWTLWRCASKYGKEVILAGGLDKRELMRDKASLRREVMSKVPYLVETGPYFPSPDHLVPIDMPFENFCTTSTCCARSAATSLWASRRVSR